MFSQSASGQHGDAVNIDQLAMAVDRGGQAQTDEGSTDLVRLHDVLPVCPHRHVHLSPVKLVRSKYFSNMSGQVQQRERGISENLIPIVEPHSLVPATGNADESAASASASGQSLKRDRPSSPHPPFASPVPTTSRRRKKQKRGYAPPETYQHLNPLQDYLAIYLDGRHTNGTPSVVAH